MPKISTAVPIISEIKSAGGAVAGPVANNAKLGCGVAVSPQCGR
jgi:hypothetical protein